MSENQEKMMTNAKKMEDLVAELNQKLALALKENEKLKNESKKQEIKFRTELGRLKKTQDDVLKDLMSQHNKEIARLKANMKDLFKFDDLEECGGKILKEIAEKAVRKKNQRCNEEIQKFAIALSSYSAKSYNFLRVQLKDVLAHLHGQCDGGLEKLKGSLGLYRSLLGQQGTPE